MKRKDYIGDKGTLFEGTSTVEISRHTLARWLKMARRLQVSIPCPPGICLRRNAELAKDIIRVTKEWFE